MPRFIVTEDLQLKKMKKAISGDHPGYLLIVDPSADFLLDLLKDPKASVFPPLVAQRGSDAIGFLKDPDLSICALYVNLDVTEPDGISVIKAAMINHPLIPVHLVYDRTRPKLDEEAQKKINIGGVVQKPLNYAELVKQYAGPSFLFDPNEALDAAKKNRDELGGQSKLNEGEFIAIRSRNVIAGKKSFFDFYVKLDNGKFVKIHRGGEEFSAERRDAYVKKGVSHFFVPKNIYNQYLAYCDRVLGAVIKHPEIPADVKATQTFDLGEKTLGYLKSAHQLDESHVQYAKSYLSRLMDLIDTLKIRQQSAMAESIIKNVTTFDHGVGSTVLSGLLAKQFNFETDKSLKIVGVASLFHDIGLADAPKTVQEEDEETMSEAHKRIYQEHPKKGATVLGSIRNIDPVVVQAVSHHHRRRDGTGFPAQTGAGMGKIPIVAEIIGICDAYIRMVTKLGEEDADPGQREIKLGMFVFNGFSIEVVTQLKNILRIEN